MVILYHQIIITDFYLFIAKLFCQVNPGQDF